MNRFNRLLLICFIIYLLWKYCYTTRLLLICEEVQRLNEAKVVPTSVQYTTRIQTVNYCVKDDARKCVPPLYPYKQRYRVSVKYHLLGCAIEKNFSTLLTAILCFLFNEDKFLRSKRNLTAETFHVRFCGKHNEYDSLESANKKLKLDLKIWRFIAVVRDPLERFVSGFADKCLREQVWKKFPSRCCGCKTNLTCFMERMYNRMMKRAGGRYQPTTFDDDHFFPQNWRCEFSTRLHDYNILHFDAFEPSPFIEKLLDIFSRNNVSERAIKFISTSLSSERTGHSTIDTLDRRKTKETLLSNKYLADLLIRMYYFDFVLFGYSIPEVFCILFCIPLTTLLWLTFVEFVRAWKTKPNAI